MLYIFILVFQILVILGKRCGPWDNLFNTTKINPSADLGKVKTQPVTAGSAYQRSRVKSVCCTFRFLLQQRCSVSVSDVLNEGLVSPATSSRSTTASVCVYYQSTLVSTEGYIQFCPTPPYLTPSFPQTQTTTFIGVGPNPSTSPSPAASHKTLPLHQSTSSANRPCSMHTHTHTHLHLLI